MIGYTGDTATVRGLRAVFQETPAKLKELEQGWRARRWRALSDITEHANNGTSGPGPEFQTGESLATRTDGGDGVVRRRRRPTSHPSPELTKTGEISKPARKQCNARAIPQTSSNEDLKSQVPHQQRAPVGPSQQPAARQSVVLPPSRSSVRNHNRVHSVKPERPKTKQDSGRPSKCGKSSQKSRPHSSASLPDNGPQSALSPTGSEGDATQHDHRHPQAIVAFPLPPIPGWAPADRDGSTLFRIEKPPTRYEIRLKMSDGVRIDVWRGGAAMQIRHLARSTEHAWVTGTRRPSETHEIRLGDWYRWTPADREKWDEVQNIAEEVKRKTPHVKIFHPLGQLVITCSGDIVLNTDPGTRLEADITRDECTQTDMTADGRACCARVTFSPSKLDLRIELSVDENSASPSTDARQDSFRSRRVVKPVSLQSSCGASRRSSGLNANPSGGKDWSHIACFGLDMGAWLPEERDAVYRLCTLRGEWVLYTKAR